jgi:methylenetetrahydrofolate dehydrogenase (NADP+)/methenyltetrahydrofolate cyclohydrolase
MPASLLDGRALAADLREGLRARSAALRERGVAPRLAIVLVGDDEASAAYVRGLIAIGAKAGVEVVIDELPANVSVRDLRARLLNYRSEPSIHGVLLQQPLPSGLPIREIAEAVPADKDVDGANPINQGRLAFATGARFVPATPAAVMLLLERSGKWPLRGREVTVIGRSNVVGLPVSLLILAENATVTVTHKETRDLSVHTRNAEIVVTATGVPGLLTGDMVRPGATVIDVGTTLVDGKIVGDVDFAGVSVIAGELTPVPGGVGPVTNVALMRNVLAAAEALSSG